MVRKRKPQSPEAAKALKPSTDDSLALSTGSALSYRFADIPENRPIFADSQTYRQADLPENRPIYAAQAHQQPPDLMTWSTTPASRPVAASEVRPVEGVTLPYNSRLFTSEMRNWPTFYLSGHRPVAPTSLVVREHPSLPNARPLGENGSDNSPDLMGFID